MLDVKEVTLRIVPLQDVLLHEQIEKKRVEQLTARLQGDWFLKNPPIVSACDGKYILLDGATRVTALRRLGCRDVAAQLVDYDAPDLLLETWNHILLDLPVADFFAALERIAGLRVVATDPATADVALAQRTSIGSILLSDGAVRMLCASHNAPLAEQSHLLNQIVAEYEGRGEMYRVAHTDLELLLAEHARLTALVVFPRFQPDEIRRLALNGAKLPMGITRHIIPGRAMRINLPLDILCDDSPLDAKNAWLAEWLKTKMRERHVRYYHEPVFLFDE